MEPANDIRAAHRTYDRFVGMVKWATPAIALLVFIVVLLIA